MLNKSRETDTLKKIVWLASYPKSGNTWFRVFLENVFSEKDEPVKINDLNSVPIASSRSLFDEHAGVSSSDLTMKEVEELRSEIFRVFARDTKGPIFMKVHDAWREAPSGKSVFPAEVTRGVIYFVRNPLDVAVSFAFHESRSPKEIARLMCDSHHAFCNKPGKLYNQFLQPLKDWSGHVKSWVDESGLPVHVVRYEDMLRNTFDTFVGALEFLSMNPSKESIQRAIEASDFERLRKIEQKEGFKEKPIEMRSFFRNGKTGTWRKHLDELSVKELITNHYEIMKRFGYLEEK